MLSACTRQRTFEVFLMICPLNALCAYGINKIFGRFFNEMQFSRPPSQHTMESVNKSKALRQTVGW